MVVEANYPCPCGGKLKVKKGRIVQQGVDCGVLEVSCCRKCGEEYLPEQSMRVVESNLKEAVEPYIEEAGVVKGTAEFEKTI